MNATEQVSFDEFAAAAGLQAQQITEELAAAWPVSQQRRRASNLPDWHNIFRLLMNGRSRLRLWEILKMTETEVAFALDQDIEKPRPAMGAMPMNPAQLQQYAAWRRSLTWKQKLELAVSDWI